MAKLDFVTVAVVELAACTEFRAAFPKNKWSAQSVGIQNQWEQEPVGTSHTRALHVRSRIFSAPSPRRPRRSGEETSLKEQRCAAELGAVAASTVGSILPRAMQAARAHDIG